MYVQFLTLNVYSQTGKVFYEEPCVRLFWPLLMCFLKVLLRKLRQCCVGQGLVKIRFICSELPQGRALWILQGRNLE